MEYIKYTPSDGKAFVRIDEPDIYLNEIYIGAYDSIDNYREVDLEPEIR